MFNVQRNLNALPGYGRACREGKMTPLPEKSTRSGEGADPGATVLCRAECDGGNDAGFAGLGDFDRRLLGMASGFDSSIRADVC